MALQTLSEFQVTDEDGHSSLIVADKLSTAAAQIEGGTGTPVLTQVARTERSVSVDVPLADIQFNTQVLPAPAAAAGCIALPTSFVVPAGSKVVLEAMAPVGSGYEFTNWNRAGTVISTDALAEIQLVEPSGDAIADIITALFTSTIA